MADKKISQLPQGNLESGTLFPIVTSGITSQTTFGDIQSAIGGGGTQDLQNVMTVGGLYQDTHKILGFDRSNLGDFEAASNYGGLAITSGSSYIVNVVSEVPNSGIIAFILRAVANKNLVFELPNTKNSGSYTLATSDDIYKLNLSTRIYANNALAIAGGLTVDDVYKTATGELRIVV
jgi:hypothetical protein